MGMQNVFTILAGLAGMCVGAVLYHLLVVEAKGREADVWREKWIKDRRRGYDNDLPVL